jgi:hypothetical protein
VNSAGQIELSGLRIASNNKSIQSYQSIPLNKWVHVAATIDMAAGDTTAQKIWIDGVDVPRLYTLTGTATALVQGTTALVVGARKSAGTDPFDGKIAQAAVFSSQLSDATVKAMANQTMTGSETGLVSAYTFNGASGINDLSANANNLTANGGALATSADSPFGQTWYGVPTGTTEYGIITQVVFSTNTTVTVQVPEGGALPTTGGIGTISYSTQKTPYGFPGQREKWAVETIDRILEQQVSPTAGVWYNPGSIQLKIPVGAWEVSYLATLYGFKSGSNNFAIKGSLSTSSSSEINRQYSVYSVGAMDPTNSTSVTTTGNRFGLELSSAETWYLITAASNATSATIAFDGSQVATRVRAECAYL